MSFSWSTIRSSDVFELDAVEVANLDKSSIELELDGGEIGVAILSAYERFHRGLSRDMMSAWLE